MVTVTQPKIADGQIGLSPYPGLRPFEAEEEALFFGREDDRDILIDKILTNPLTMLFAASGVGKSSLLNASVLPKLRSPTGENLTAIYINTWVSAPRRTVKQAVLKHLEDKGLISSEVFEQGLDNVSLSTFFQFATVSTRLPLVLVLDQFEEFFRYHRHSSDHEFDYFLDELTELITASPPSVAVVISMREDFALELNAMKSRLPTLLFQNFYRLERLTREEARLAIVEPAERWGFAYEPELLAELEHDLSVRELRRQHQIAVPEIIDAIEPPYLQIVCIQLWEIEQDHAQKTIRLDTYKQRGRATGLLRSYLESVLSRFSYRDQELASLAFNHLVTRREAKIAYSAEDLARQVSRNVTALEPVLQKLETSRVLRTQDREGVPWFELYHDIFSESIENWNDAFKARQRLRKAGLMAALIILAGIGAFSGLSYFVNTTSHHLRLSIRRDEPQRIEIFRGSTRVYDLFGRRRFRGETIYSDTDLEPDRIFEMREITDFSNVHHSIVQSMPFRDRLMAYWNLGLTGEPFKRVAEALLQNRLSDSRKPFLRLLSGLPSREVIALLIDHYRNYADDRKFLHDILPISHPAVLFLLEHEATQDHLEASKDLARWLSEHHVSRVLLAHFLSDPDTYAILLPSQWEVANSDEQKKILAEISRVFPSATVENQLALIKKLTKLGPHGIQALSALRTSVTNSGVRDALENFFDPDRARQRKENHLIKQLAQTEGDQAKKLIDQLAGSGGSLAETALIDVVSNRDQELRIRAIQVLGKFRSSRARKEVVARLNDLDPQLQEFAITALSQMDRAASIPHILPFLKSRNPQLRIAAVDGLQATDDASVIQSLIPLLEDPSYLPRIAATRALENLASATGDMTLIAKGLEAILSHADSYVRLNAVITASRLPNHASFPVLRLAVHDPDSLVANTAIAELGRRRDRQVLDDLRKLLKQPPKVRQTVATALMRIGDARVVPDLRKALAVSKGKTALQIARALHTLGDPMGSEWQINFIRRSLSYDQKEQLSKEIGTIEAARLLTIKSLLTIRTKEAIRVLEDATQDSNPKVQFAAVKALSTISHHFGRKPLITALSASDSPIRNEAIKGLLWLAQADDLEALHTHIVDHGPTPNRAVETIFALGDPRIIDNYRSKLSRSSWFPLAQLSNALTFYYVLVRDKGIFRRGVFVQTPIPDFPSSRGTAEVFRYFAEQRHLNALLSDIPQKKQEIKKKHEFEKILNELKSDIPLKRTQNQILQYVMGQGWQEQEYAALWLGREAPDGASALLTILFKEPDQTVRFAASLALARLGHENHIRQVLLILGSSYRLREYAEETFLALSHEQQKLSFNHLKYDLFDQFPIFRSRIHNEYESIDKERIVKALVKSKIPESRSIVATFAVSEVSEIRQIAASVLRHSRDQRAKDLLIIMLQDIDENVVETAGKSLLHINAAMAHQHLLPLLQSPYTKIQVAAARALKKAPAPAIVSEVEPLLADTKQPLLLRLELIELLGTLGNDRAVDVLKTFVSSEVTPLALRATRVLRDFGDVAKDALLAKLDAYEKAMADWRQERDRAAKAAQQEAASTLERSYVQSPDPYVPFEAAVVLGRTGDLALVLQLLSHALADIREGAAVGIAAVATPEVISRLHQERLKRDDPLFRSAAYRAIDLGLMHIERTGDASALKPLQTLYKTANGKTGIGPRLEWTIAALQRQRS